MDRQGNNEKTKTRKWFSWKKVGAFLGLIVLFVFIASVFVANYEPDPQDTFLLGQSTLYSGNLSSPRIVVRNFTNQKPIEGASVNIKLVGNGISQELGQFTTNKQGSISEPINIPPVPEGKYTLIIDSQSKIGKDHIENQVQIKKPYKVYITTDKPIYQPGQTLHMRAMVLNKTNLKPFSKQSILFEVEDPKGNKIFKEQKETSDYGIASADLDIASEVNLGRYRVRVVIGDEESEKVVTVKKYVLPKYKVHINTDRPYYLPASQLKGTVSTQYFFGKPVEKASVEIIGKTIIEEPSEIFKITGNTDSEGFFTFETTLADYFTGIPLAGGNALLQLEATVKDTAGHEESITHDLVVAQNPIQITVFPESGELVSGVENILYIMTTYPHGEPATCTGKLNGHDFVTDSFGIAGITITPEQEQCNIRISVYDKQGNQGQFKEDIKLAQYAEAFLLRTDKALYQAGDTLEATLLSSLSKATFFIDIIKDRQTVLTQTVDVENGTGQLAIDLPPSLFGTLKLNAYFITPSGESKRDSRVIHVSKPQQLQIQASLDQETYRPAETANISFVVSDSEGNPIPAALSLSAVDEAVFYVGENRPGLMEQFFQADAELLKPAYQTKFTISPKKLLDAESDEQNLAKALFANISNFSDPWGNLERLQGVLEQEEVEHYKTQIESGLYDDLFNDPQYKELGQLFKPGANDYTLKSTTFAQKKARSDRFRERYFSTLKVIGVATVILGFFASLIVVAIYNTIKMHKVPNQLDEKQGAIYRSLNRITLSSSLYLLVPIITYPLILMVGSFLWDIFTFDEDIWLLFAFLANLVIATLLVSLQFKSCHTLSKSPDVSETANMLFAIPIIYIIQYVITRIVMIVATTEYAFDEYGFIALLSSLLATSFVLVLSVILTKKVASRLQIILPQKKGFTVIELLVVIAIIAFLSAICMPALSKVKKCAQRVVLASELKGLGMAQTVYADDYSVRRSPTSGSTSQLPRIRKFFPETLLWQPELITDENGKAILSLQLADSITTWKMNADAVSAEGQLGSHETDITVFQDFFIDLDLPVCLTQNDVISIPVVCYNYLAEPQQVKLNLKSQEWYSLQGVDTITVELGPNEVKSAYFNLKADKAGKHQLTVIANGQSTSDAIQRTIEVRPDGTEIVDIQEGSLASSVEHSFVIPTDAIPNSQSLILKVYPTTFSVLLEGLDNIFKKPHGCFEQTSSTTYPNVMALQYMKETGQATPEVEVKARKFITAGYQRLLTFEVDGGGFDWFGHPPANELLTAYGLMEFSDMSEVHNIDPSLINRTSQWLLSKQRSDGSWSEGSLHGTLSAVDGDLTTTAYVTWALVESNQKGQEVRKALNYLQSHLKDNQDPYVLALVANAFLTNNPQDAFGRDLVNILVSKFNEDDKVAHLSSNSAGAMYSTGVCLDIETTALGTLAMLKCHRHPALVKKSLTWLSQQKDQFGTWHSTHATILALKALIAGTGTSLGGEESTEITVVVNDQSVSTIQIEPEKSDVMNFVSLTDHIHSGKNIIHLKCTGNQELPFQIVGTYWIPWKQKSVKTVKELDIEVSYDKKKLKVEDMLICNVIVTNNKKIPINMAIVDLGIPPGFTVDHSSFQKLVSDQVLAKYEATGNQCILYVRDIAPEKPLELQYSLKAKYPIKAQIPSSGVYEYYNPQNKDYTQSTSIEVLH